MHYLGVQSITQNRGDVALRKTKINLSTKSLDPTNLCQLRQTMFRHQQLWLRAQ